MPIFFQHQVNESTRLGIWKIEETEDFFLKNVPLHREVTHPHKRLQHLAGRFLLQFLFPDFPYELIRIADTRKPYLPNEEYHFSISHCADYAAAAVSRDNRVGVDIEIPTGKADKIIHKFLNDKERKIFQLADSMPTANWQSPTGDQRLPTLLWSCKESIFKWYGDGGVDFKHHIQLLGLDDVHQTVNCFFAKTNQELVINCHNLGELVLAWVMS